MPASPRLDDDGEEHLCDFHKHEEMERVKPRVHKIIRPTGKNDESDKSYSAAHDQCEECGHVCVTATEQTSEAPEKINPESLELENERNRRKHFSPLVNRVTKAAKADDGSSSDADRTVSAHPEDPNILSGHKCCKEVYKVPVKCNNCGSKNVIRKGEDDIDQDGLRLIQVASERYGEKADRRSIKPQGIFEHGQFHPNRT